MYILGISAFYHDSAAALLLDGDLVAAAQEERFSRIKFDARFPTQAISFCLQHANIQVQDLDYVVFYEKPLRKFERILQSQLTTFPRSWQAFRESMTSWFQEKLWTRALIQRSLPLPAERILFVEHHLSHAASAMFCSPFADAAVLTVDGVGEWTTTALGYAQAAWEPGGVNRLDLREELSFPHSLGLLYSCFTAWLGFKVNSGEYKVMGLAAYGRPRYVDKVEQLIQVDANGSFRLNMDYFSFHYAMHSSFSAKFTQLFGVPRPPEAPFQTDVNGKIIGTPREVASNQLYADIAASLQVVIEETLLRITRHLHRTTGSKNLVMAGGVALNSVANGRIIEESPFDQVYIQPNAGDAGGALGAALYAWHVLLGKPRRFLMAHAAYGQAYAESTIAHCLQNSNLRFEVVEDEAQIANQVVDAILQKQVVGLFQGRFEWGPRALGNRSIIADSRWAEVKETVNSKIKYRESFRPFAPVIPEHHSAQVFDLKKAKGQYPLRFMLMVAPIRTPMLDKIAAVNHMGTGRLQTVYCEHQPLYFDIVEKFGQATGVPVLLNTSFNLRGEPIVSTPAEALTTFMHSDLDLLVLGHHLVRKKR